MDDGDIEREVPGAKQARYLGEEDGGEVGAAFVDGTTYIFADEEGVVTEGGAVFWRGGGVFTSSEHVDDFDVAQVWRAGNERFEEGRGDATPAADVDALTRLDGGQCFFCGHGAQSAHWGGHRVSSVGACAPLSAAATARVAGAPRMRPTARERALS